MKLHNGLPGFHFISSEQCWLRWLSDVEIFADLAREKLVDLTVSRDH